MTLIFDATNAYLGPLLAKHTAGQPLVWEDLVASQAACSAVLSQCSNPFVSSRMEKLHQSQVKAYREAGIHSIKEWAQSYPLQPMEEGDSKITFVNRCITSINTVTGANGLPNWKLDNVKLTAMSEIRKRACATFEKYHPTEDDVPDKENEKAAATASGETATADEAEDDSEGGVETEDGELTSDGDEASDAEQTTGKYVHPNRKKNKVAGVKKNIGVRKSNKVKNNFRNNKGGRGARRGGRGGGGRGQK